MCWKGNDRDYIIFIAATEKVIFFFLGKHILFKKCEIQTFLFFYICYTADRK